MTSRIQDVSYAQIVRGPNDRHVFREAELQELVDSIAAHGLAQPPTVRPVWQCESCEGVTADQYVAKCPQCGAVASLSARMRYELVCGERRWLAVGQLGWPTIPCLVRAMDDRQASAVMLLENLHRVDLNPIEEGRAYAARLERFGLTSAELAAEIQKSEAHVQARLSLLTLIPELQILVQSGQLGVSVGSLLARLDSDRQRLATRVAGTGKALTLEMWRDVTSKLLAEQEQDALFDLTDLLVQNYESKQRVATTGRAAQVALPVGAVPIPRFTGAATGDIFFGYIQDLQAGEHSEGAAAVAALYRVLLDHARVAIPQWRLHTR